jgi:hypothetical protein
MISEDIIQKNKEKYLATINKYSLCNDKLINALGDNLFRCPASTMINLHNAFEGGLVDHLLTVAKYAVNINNSLPENMRCGLESVLKVSLLCEIGKVGKYKPTENEWKKKNGTVYEFIEDEVSLSIGQRSVYFLNITDNPLDMDEYQAINTFDVNTEMNAMVKWHSTTLTVILRQAIELAIMEEKFKYKHG